MVVYYCEEQNNKDTFGFGINFREDWKRWMGIDGSFGRHRTMNGIKGG